MRRACGHPFSTVFFPTFCKNQSYSFNNSIKFYLSLLTDPQTQLLSYMIMNKPKTTNQKTLSNRDCNLRQISSQIPTMHRQPAGKQPIEDERLSDHSFDDPEVNQSAPDNQDWTTLPCLLLRSDSPLMYHSSTQSLESFNNASQWERSHLHDKTTSEQLLMNLLKLSYHQK